MLRSFLFVPLPLSLAHTAQARKATGASVAVVAEYKLYSASLRKVQTNAVLFLYLFLVKLHT